MLRIILLTPSNNTCCSNKQQWLNSKLHNYILWQPQADKIDRENVSYMHIVMYYDIHYTNFIRKYLVEEYTMHLIMSIFCCFFFGNTTST